MVAYNNKKYDIDIIESKPAPAISIIETDCEVDFAPALDYPKSLSPYHHHLLLFPHHCQVEEPKFSSFTGAGKWLDGKPSKHPHKQQTVIQPTVIQHQEALQAHQCHP
ncbi:unnamed protein product [Sphagnum balticum]